MKRLLLVVLALAALDNLVEPAHAAIPKENVMVAPVAIDRAALRLFVEEGRRTSPASFAAIAKLRAELPGLEAHKRGPLVVLQNQLRALGKQAVPAMVDALDLEGKGDRSLRVALVEAIGWHRVMETRALLVALLGDSDPMVVRAAAEAIGRFADDESVRTLSARLDVPAVVAGVGTCRRLAMATALGKKLDSKAAVRALAELGSSWAWRTGLPYAGEERGVRATAAAALVDAFVRDPSLRSEASNALMVVDDPSTPALVAAAKPFASSDTVAALDRLLARFAANPAR